MACTVLTVVGARPQLIKAGPVSRALCAAGIREVLVHTGQHYDPDMSGRFFEELGLPAPSMNLGIGSGSHAVQTSRMIAALEGPMTAYRPDWVLIYGDTNSTLAAAIVASKLLIPVAHVEAGLRSRNRGMPEEVNRTVADALSALFFAPTENARRNLLDEAVPPDRIRLVGDVMLDAVRLYGRLAECRNDLFSALELARGEYILATIHRAENTDNPCRLRCLLDAMNEIDTRTPVVFPLHPRTRAAIGARWVPAPNIHVVDPVGYLEMIRLTANAGLVLTDSGGLQKEAFFHSVPCVTLRNETEWVELVELGWNRLAPPVSVASVLSAVHAAWGTRGERAEPYGDGTAAVKIAQALAEPAPGAITS